MDGRRDLFLSKVIHKAFIKVYEEGTVAAAATGSAVGYGAAEETYVSFNRPFVYVIRDEVTGQILFIGRVVDPS
jgi:serpin B